MSRKNMVIIIVSVTVVMIVNVVSIVVWVLEPILNNPYDKFSYTIEHVECIAHDTSRECTIALTLYNGSTQEFTPDFTGTDGPGFAESGIWGAYSIDQKANKAEMYVDREEFDASIPAKSSVKTHGYVTIPAGSSIRAVELFDIKQNVAQAKVAYGNKI